MRGPEAISELLARIGRTRGLLQKIVDEYTQFLAGDFCLLGRKNASAIVIAELMVNYYTCAETLFLRISQFFENDLDGQRWHSDLLEKMLLRIDGVRDPVLSEATAQPLGELMRFRHFRRYYFELEYDWGKLEYLQGVFGKVADRLPSDLAAFESFLTSLQGAGDE